MVISSSKILLLAKYWCTHAMGPQETVSFMLNQTWEY